MTSVELQTDIAAPPEVCFDLARDVNFHARSLASTGETIVDRTGSGLLQLGDEVEFEGRHLGLRRRLRARIVAFDRPRRFCDAMVCGPFRSFSHEHIFEPDGSGTRMVDRVSFAVPGGPPGILIARLILRPYMARLLATRGEQIKIAAEQGQAKPGRI